ncbi:MAG TPA: hypothetical protein PLB31_03365 [Fimbriimonadaceae bacterium]|nr:hypothetical protein [Fimbriimonadaceae bacterium]HRE93327.1 hypothetical protein [Fimbriimonadaceae bacterium]HRI73489.1 hypothetical protein [Fimbriimonadaceae bacterium]
MIRKPTGFGLGGACLALALAASVPVGGCRGGSPVRVVQAESSGVGTSEVVTPLEVPAELQKAHRPIFRNRLQDLVDYVVDSLEAPIEVTETKLGFSRALPIKIGDHTIGGPRNSSDSGLLLFGNSTSPIEPNSWAAKAISSSGVVVVQERNQSKLMLEPLAKEAANYYEAGYRGNLRWKNDDGLMEARPVVLKDKTCLNCHKDSELGDVAGIVIARLNPDEIKQIEEWQARRNAKSNP